MIAAGFALLRGPAADDEAAQAADPALAGDHICDGFDALNKRRRRRGAQGLLPAGVGHRSHGHTHLMRKEIELRVERNKNEKKESGRLALGGVWNECHGLRIGDCAEVEAIDGTGKILHPNTWTHVGLLKIGWGALGNHVVPSRGANCIGETHRQADGLLCLARAIQKCSGDRWSGWLSGIPANQAVHVERHYDPTQLFLRFGRLQQVLQPSARYLVPDDARPGRFRSVPWDEYRAMYPRSTPAKGLVEFMAQTIDVYTSDARHHDDARSLLLAPSILSHGNASVTYEAIEHGTPEFALDTLLALASTRKLVTLSEVPDNNAVNKCKKRFTAHQLPDNILYTPLGCCAHLLHRAIATGTGEDNIAGDVHACFVVTRHPGHREKLLKAAFEVVDEDFEVRAGPPPDEIMKHTRAIIEHTLLRTMDQTSGTVLRHKVPDANSDVDVVDELATDVPFNRRLVGTGLLATCP